MAGRIISPNGNKYRILHNFNTRIFLLFMSRHSRWIGRVSSCLLKSISRVQFPSSAPTRTDFFLHKNWLAESARACVSNIRWKSTSSGNAELYARQKLKALTGGGEGTTPLTTACPEGRWGWNLLRVELENKSYWKKKQMCFTLPAHWAYTKSILVHWRYLQHP